MASLQDLQQSQGGQFSGDRVLISCDRDAEALIAATSGVALIDRTHWGLIELTGDDRLRFLHNQTTNSFTDRQPGDGCDTVFVTATARTIDLTTVYITGDAMLIVTSPGYDQRLIDWMDRYIFPADKVALKNLSEATAVFSLVGPQSQALLNQCGVTMADDLSDGQHREASIADIPLRVAVGSGLGLPGYTLLVPSDGAAAVWGAIAAAGAVPAGDRLWQQLRVQQGRPAPGAELTEDYNPLEAGLWQTISFDKGCYIGQETIARLNTYQGVKQQLWGLELSGPAEVGMTMAIDGDRVGKLTSVVAAEGKTWGLGYVRTKAGGAGAEVTLGDIQGRVVDVPFLARGYLDGAG